MIRLSRITLHVSRITFHESLMPTLDSLGNLRRTHYSGDLRPEHAGEVVTLMGWVHRRRDFGPLTFIDLRDREGIVQIVFDEEKNAEVHRRAKELRGENVVAVVGKVLMRDKEKINSNLKSGRIEVKAMEKMKKTLVQFTKDQN